MEKSLFWHQGLFLQPQHLQLNDLHQQSMFTPYHQWLKPFMTGVAAMSIRESALSNYSFQIDRGAFWFPDKTYVVLWENAVIEPRYIKDDWHDGDKPLIVYLGLRKNDPQGINVRDTAGGNPARFVGSPEPDVIPDLHQGGHTAPVKRLNYALHIFFHTEIDRLGAYDLIPVARIVRQGDDVRLDREYVPPCVTVSGSPVLAGLARDLAEKLAFRGRELESHKKKRGIHNAEFGPRDMVYLLALRSLNRYIPWFQRLNEDTTIHPYDLYALLRQVIGELSSFSDTMDVLGRDDNGQGGLPAYDHKNLWTCFSRAAVLVTALLDQITAGPEYVLPLSCEDFQFSCALSGEHLEGDNRYYLVVRTESDIGEVLDAVDIDVKVCSLKLLPLHIERALPGARLEHLPVPPQELPRHRNASYFLIDQHGDPWSQIEKDRSLGVHWNSPPGDMAMELMIVRRK
jgi:type VI secretion system protein ImpJ